MKPIHLRFTREFFRLMPHAEQQHEVVLLVVYVDKGATIVLPSLFWWRDRDLSALSVGYAMFCVKIPLLCSTCALSRPYCGNHISRIKGKYHVTVAYSRRSGYLRSAASLQYPTKYKTHRTTTCTLFRIVENRRHIRTWGTKSRLITSPKEMESEVP